MSRRQYMGVAIAGLVIFVIALFFYFSIRDAQHKSKEVTPRYLAVIDVRNLTFDVVKGYIRFDVVNLGNNSFKFAVKTYSTPYVCKPLVPLSNTRACEDPFVFGWKNTLPEMHFTVDPNAFVKVEIKTNGISVPDTVWIEVESRLSSQEAVFVKTKDSVYSEVMGKAVIVIAWVDKEVQLKPVIANYFRDRVTGAAFHSELSPYERIVSLEFVKDALMEINYKKIPVPLVFYQFVLKREKLDGSALILYYTGPLASDIEAFKRSAFSYLYDIGKSIVKSGGVATTPFIVADLIRDYDWRWWKLEENDITGVAMFFSLPIGEEQDSTTVFDFTKLPFTTGISDLERVKYRVFLLGGVNILSRDGAIYWKDFTGRYMPFTVRRGIRYEYLYFWRVYGTYMGYFTYETVLKYVSKIAENMPPDIGGLPGLMAGIDFRYAIGELVVK